MSIDRFFQRNSPPTEPQSVYPARLRRSASRARHSHRRWLAVALTASLTALFFVSLFLSLRIAELRQTNTEISKEFAKARSKVAELEPQVERLRAGLDAAIQDRMPRLQQIVFNETLPVDDDVVKAILFTQERKSERANYGISVITENSMDLAVQPTVRVLVFDEYGVQLTGLNITSVEVLQPGDSRSMTRYLEPIGSDTPAYFRLEADTPSYW